MLTNNNVKLQTCNSAFIGKHFIKIEQELILE